MRDSLNFNARSIHTIGPDRIYRVELCNGALYFLRVGSQFNLDRDPGVSVRKAPAILVLAAGEALFRKHKKEELVARDPNQDPEELLAIHPHNFKLVPDDIDRAVFLPKKWFLSLFRVHFGRLQLVLADGKRWEFHFESAGDLQTALQNLRTLLGDRLETTIAWDAERQRFTKVSP